MTTNPVVLRARLQQIQMELCRITLDTTDPMTWQALHCACDSLGWAISGVGRLVVDKLTKAEQAEEAATRG